MSKLNINSDRYILTFAIIMTIVLGTLLSLVALALADRQKAEKDFEQQKYILTSVLGSEKVGGMSKSEITEMYGKSVTDLAVNEKGIQIDAKVKDIVMIKEYKKLNKDGTLKSGESLRMPVYMFKGDDGKVTSYILPVFGFGLWDNIWGFIALEADLNTVRGVVFDHKGETPGLGARITEDKVRSRFIGKKIYNEEFFAVLEMMKGEGKDYKSDMHKVDGMSGATLTAIGLNNMLKNYFNLYQNYFKTIKS